MQRSVVCMILAVARDHNQQQQQGKKRATTTTRSCCIFSGDFLSHKNEQARAKFVQTLTASDTFVCRAALKRALLARSLTVGWKPYHHYMVQVANALDIIIHH